MVLSFWLGAILDSENAHSYPGQLQVPQLTPALLLLAGARVQIQVSESLRNIWYPRYSTNMVVGYTMVLRPVFYWFYTKGMFPPHIFARKAFTE